MFESCEFYRDDEELIHESCWELSSLLLLCLNCKDMQCKCPEGTIVAYDLQATSSAFKALQLYSPIIALKGNKTSYAACLKSDVAEHVRKLISSPNLGYHTQAS